MKPVFDINNFTDGRYLMKCSTREESDFFRLFLHDIDRRWNNGTPYTEEDHYINGRDIFYAFNMGCAGTMFTEQDYAENHSIIYFEDFYWVGYNTPYDEFEVNEEIDSFLNSFCTKG